jgi:hypothetical protein
MPCATLTVTAPAQPNISVVSVRLNPSSVNTGDSFEIYATLQNTGNADGYVNLRVTLQGSQIASYSNLGPVKAGQSVEVWLGRGIAPSTAGSYQVCVEKV